jgi:hypothetical protein
MKNARGRRGALELQAAGAGRGQAGAPRHGSHSRKIQRIKTIPWKIVSGDFRAEFFLGRGELEISMEWKKATRP